MRSRRTFDVRRALGTAAFAAIVAAAHAPGDDPATTPAGPARPLAGA